MWAKYQKQSASSINPRGFTVIELLVIIVVAIVMATLAFVFGASLNKNINTKPDSSQQTVKKSEVSPSQARDKVRHEHAINLATDLFYAHALQKRTIDLSQRGFDSLSSSSNKDPLLDPLTHKTYVFNKDQSTMEPGEVTFRVGATCDNKISGSQGKGLIVDASTNSGAVALKLESGSFACEASGI